jgi:drug/metabolite transporter (DMT)-like permease
MLLFALIRSAGPSRTSLVTYLIPGIAVVYGAVLLNEPLRTISLGGLVLILAGTALAARGRASSRASVPAPAVAES